MVLNNWSTSESVYDHIRNNPPCLIENTCVYTTSDLFNCLNSGRFKDELHVLS